MAAGRADIPRGNALVRGAGRIVTFATLSPMRYPLNTLGGFRYGSMNQKPLIQGFSQIVKRTCGHHSTSNSIKANEPALILLPALSLPQHPAGCKLSFVQVATTRLDVVKSYRTSVLTQQCFIVCERTEFQVKL